MGKMAFVFPGQGTQYVGMGQDIYKNYAEAREVFDRANEIMGMDIKKLCFEGPEEEIIKTENQQPTIHTTEIALLRVIEKFGIKPDITAGFSLGEYAALVCAKSLKFEDTVSLVNKRGNYMQNAVPIGVGKMVAISGLQRERVFEIVKESSDKGTIECSNFNCPGQIIVSGYAAAVEKAAEIAKESGARGVTFLKVSAPFHTSLLEGAGKNLRKELDKIEVNLPKIDYITNVTAKLVNKEDNIRELLQLHVSKAVLWEDTIDEMVKLGVDTFVEIGPSGSLTKFNKRTVDKHGIDAKYFHVQDANGLEEFLKHIK